MKNTIIYLIFLCLINFNVQALMLYTLSNHDNSGDHNQVLGIITALKRLSDQGIIVKDLNTTIMDASKIKNEIKKNLPHEKIIVIGAGEGAIDGVAELPANLNLIICLTSHMFLERYKDPNLLEKVRFIASMNEVHKAHLASELAAGRISILNSAHELTFPSLNSDTPQLNAAMTIAQKICEEVRQEK